MVKKKKWVDRQLSWLERETDAHMYNIYEHFLMFDYRIDLHMNPTFMGNDMDK